MKFKKLVEGYHLYCQAEAKSPYAIPWYMGQLRIFMRCLRKKGAAPRQMPSRPKRFAP